MSDQDLKSIIEQQPFAPLILLAIDLAAWLKPTPEAENNTGMDNALTA